MKTISTALSAHLQQEVTTLAWLVKLTRRDGTVLAFTSFDRDLTIAGTTFKSADGFAPSSIDTQAGLAPDNLELMGTLTAGAIAEGDIDAGRYDGASVEFSVCNWADLSQGVLKLKRGTVGTISRMNGNDGGSYRFEITGLADALATTIGDCYTKACRYAFGDARCTIDATAASWRKTSTLTAIVDNVTLADSTRSESAGFFAYGTLTFTSGANAGQSTAIKNFASGQFTLWQPLSLTPAVGDAYTVTAGCDKQFATCKSKFANAVNFGGFPHIPGNDAILTTPPVRS